LYFNQLYSYLIIDELFIQISTIVLRFISFINVVLTKATTHVMLIGTVYQHIMKQLIIVLIFSKFPVKR
jgi:hypothetical protein